MNIYKTYNYIYIICEYNTYVLLYMNTHSYIFKCNKNLGLIWKNKSFKMLKFTCILVNSYFTIQSSIVV